MRLLVLGFEDHRRPGAGGGSNRNHEINKRLVALGHEVTVVTAKYLGARARDEDGVAYRQIGVSRGYFTSLLSYQAALPLSFSHLCRRYRPEVIAEEFAPPWSSMSVGRWTNLPTIGLVHGYFAAEKARQYHMPAKLLLRIEGAGTRSHRYLVTNSADTADQLLSVAPHASVAVCSTGLNHSEIDNSFVSYSEREVLTKPRTLVFLGRIEMHQKGLDLLLCALGRMLDVDFHLTIAGDGPDVDRVRALALQQIPDRFQMVGRVSGNAKWRLLASGQVVVMPSRYETFGRTAVEAMACATPVVAFNIPSLRQTLAGDASKLVKAFSVEELEACLRACLADDRWSLVAGRAGRRQAAELNWDRAAREHEKVYEAACAGRKIAIDADLRPLL